MWRKLILAMIMLLPLASSATIYGNTYDYSLKLLKDARVEIDTMPQQVMVTREGSYSFNAPIGNYIISATKNGLTAREDITIIDDGTYTLDLILAESLEEDTSLLQDGAISIDPSETNNDNYIKLSLIVLMSVILLAFAGYLAHRFIKDRKYNEDYGTQKGKDDEGIRDDLNKLLKIIKDEGGRTTQKEIRKRLGLSEAKISLMVAELESKGIVKKIKKGRGNIVILA